MARVVHFEVHASDPERAVRFYRELFGWQAQKWAGPMDYWLLTTGPDDQRGINGGLMVRHGPAPGPEAAVMGYVCTVGVGSVDECMARVHGLGGTIAMPKMAVPGVGWLVYAKDTEGNVFGMLQPDVGAK